MAVEKLKMMNVVGPLKVMNQVIADILKMGTVNFIPAQQEIDHNAFVFSLEEEENVKKVLELNKISEIQKNGQREDIRREAKEIMEFFAIDHVEDEGIKKASLEDFHPFYKKIHEKMKIWEELVAEEENLEAIAKNYRLFKNVEVDLSQLEELEYFDVRYGALDRDGRYRLKKNYGNLLAMIYHTGSMDGKEIYLAIYPKEVSHEMDRVLRSLNWQDIPISKEYRGTAEEVLERLHGQKIELEKRKRKIEEDRQIMLREKKEQIHKFIADMLLYEKVEEVKEMMIKSPTYFYLSGWIGVSDIPSMKNILSSYPDLTVDFRDPGEEEGKPPTKLKNNRLFRPFEMLIKMYGVPNYKELDPTFFFGLTYLLLFGAMFGDVGQGGVFALVGYFLLKLKGMAIGSLMIPMGFSSMVFGLLYGSFFGSENLLPALWIKPFDQVNKALIFAIAFGIMLIVSSYILGFINKYRQEEWEEGLFGKEGLAGFLVYLAMLNAGLSLVGKNPISLKISIFVMGAALVAMIFSQPLTQKLQGRKIYYQRGRGDYYVEGVFSILEALLSILSNMISFIRVGAFAINHVGLFLAFQTVGKMIGNAPGNFFVLVVGNLIILTLEGLIVFIQSLRLEYYEMFSKYYLGDGYEFVAHHVERKI